MPVQPDDAASPFPDDQPGEKPFWEQIIVQDPVWSLGSVALGPKRSVALEIRVFRDARTEVVRLDGQPLRELRVRHQAAIDVSINRLMAEMRAERTGRISKAMQPITQRTARSIRTPHPDELNAQLLSQQQAAERQAQHARAIAEQISFAERMQRRRQEVESTRSFRRQDPSPPA